MLKHILLGLSVATLIALPLITSANARSYGGETGRQTRNGTASYGRAGSYGQNRVASHDFGGGRTVTFRGSRGDRGHMRDSGGYHGHDR